jgi:hypothetical protein
MLLRALALLNSAASSSAMLACAEAAMPCTGDA